MDVLDLHWYPEAKGGGVRITEQNNSADVVAARVQAPRSLWDPSYQETSWITSDARSGPIRLIRRMQEKIATHYPGTRLAITEYNYGGGDHISGAIAQADVLGIFGREDVFAAALWDLQGVTRFVDAGFAAYCNYDGGGSRFGDTSVGAATSNDETTSIYASVDEGRDDRMVLVAVNKSTGTTSAEIALTHGTRAHHRAGLADLRQFIDSHSRGRYQVVEPQPLQADDAGVERHDSRPHALVESGTPRLVSSHSHARPLSNDPPVTQRWISPTRSVAWHFHQPRRGKGGERGSLQALYDLRDYLPGASCLLGVCTLPVAAGCSGASRIYCDRALAFASARCFSSRSWKARSALERLAW